MNQIQLVRQRRKINGLLVLLSLTLCAWLVVGIVDELQAFYRQQKPLTANKIILKRTNNTIRLDHQQGEWQVTAPYNNTASKLVVDALLSRLQAGCRTLEEPPSRLPQSYADIYVDESHYEVGELNAASDEVYVKHNQQWLLCDKLIASMALAPAINFIDKQLYTGDLKAIVGDFGRLTDFSGIDLSVLELAPADIDALPSNAISKLIFEAKTERAYAAFLSEDSRHLLLFDATKSLIYVLPAQEKLNAIMGL